MNTVAHFYNKIENEREDIFLLGLIKIKKEMRGSVYIKSKWTCINQKEIIPCSLTLNIFYF